MDRTPVLGQKSNEVSLHVPLIQGKDPDPDGCMSKWGPKPGNTLCPLTQIGVSSRFEGRHSKMKA